MKLYRGYELNYDQPSGQWLALDTEERIIARAETEEKLMDAIDAFKRKQREKQR